MADKNTGKPIKNSLLSLASSSFSFEDFTDARLLVPLSEQEEILKSTPEATAEIDLGGDEILEEKPTHLLLSSDAGAESQDSLKGDVGGILRDSSFISLFTKSKEDSLQLINPFPASIPTSNLTGSSKLSPETSNPQSEADLKSSKISMFTPSLSQAHDPFSSVVNQFQPSNPAPLESASFIDTSNIPFQTISASSVSAPLSYGATSHESASASGTTSANIYSVPLASHPPPPTNSVGTSVASVKVPEYSAAANLHPIQSPPPDATAHPNQDVGPSSAGTVSAKGSINKYRLGNQRLQYAQYPGLLPTVPAVGNSMGNLVTQPPPLPPTTHTTVPGATVGAATNLTSPLTPSCPQEYAGTGYVFGEPAPQKTATNMYPMQYTPVSYHWFFYKEVEGKGIWKPFSFLDSVALEDAFLNNSTTLVASDGGRYDVNVMQRLRIPVYWEESPTEVRRCSWFYKGPLDNRFIPYEEDFAQQIETEFENAITTGIWQRRVELGGGEAIILHNANVIVHFCQAASPDEWGNLPESQLRPRVVKRGVDKSFMIEDGESTQIDHLVFLVHGIGAICDFKFRSIVEAVDDFRSLSAQLLHTHFSTALDRNMVGRIEFLPVCWHKALHGDCGVDRKLKPITLPSIPKLRHFTNDTLLDILFYTSPVYCQRIVDTVGNEINRMFNLFLQRNLNFDGSVSLGGHSLGSLILFDLLTHQPANVLRVDSSKSTKEEASKDIEDKAEEVADLNLGAESTPSSGSSKLVSYTIGQAGTGQPAIVYPAFDFHPTCFFAMGSPTGVFISVRGIDHLGDKFKFPTCRSFFNIFHPYDPVAYRMEPLIDPTFDKPPVVIPHHKGRKRFHLEIKDAMFRMGTDLKQTMVDTLKNTWKTVYQLASFRRSDDTSNTSIEQEIDMMIEGELNKADENQNTDSSLTENVSIGELNGGRRIDYVLQEGPLESFNEYLFALSSHVCYWESEDTMLLIMKEIYQSIGVFADNSENQLRTPATQNINAPFATEYLPASNTHMSVPPQPLPSASVYSYPGNLNPYAGYSTTPIGSTIVAPPPTHQNIVVGLPPSIPVIPPDSGYYNNILSNSDPFNLANTANSSGFDVSGFQPTPNIGGSFSLSGSHQSVTSRNYPYPTESSVQPSVPIQGANQPSSVPTDQYTSTTPIGPIGPPPLSGFVRKS